MLAVILDGRIERRQPDKRQTRIDRGQVVLVDGAEKIVNRFEILAFCRGPGALDEGDIRKGLENLLELGFVGRHIEARQRAAVSEAKRVLEQRRVAEW